MDAIEANALCATNGRNTSSQRKLTTKHEDPSSYHSIDGESHKEFDPSDEYVEVVDETLESIADIPPTSIQGIDSTDNVDTSGVIREDIEEVRVTAQDGDDMAPYLRDIKQTEQMEQKDKEKFNVDINNKITRLREDGRKTPYYHCSACNVKNMLDSDDTNKLGLSNLIHHRQTDLHCYNVQSLAGRKSTENTVVRKIFAEIEKTVGENIVILGEGFVTYRCCKGIKILFRKGSFMTKIEDHLNDKDLS